MVRLPLVLQRPTQAPQLFQRRPHGGVQGQHLRGSKNLLPGPCQSPQAAECVRPLAGEARGLSGFAQLMDVFVPDAGEEPGPHSLLGAHRVKEAGDEAHVADLQHEVPPGQGQAPQGQGHHLGRSGIIHGTDALQAHLTDLPEGMALLAGAVDVFLIVVPAAAAGPHLGILGDGEGHVRLQRQQPPVQVRKGDDLLAGKKTAVLLIETVFLEPTHVVFAEALLFIQQPQLQRCPLLGPQDVQIQFHGDSPPGGLSARVDFSIYFTLFY